MIDNDRLYEIHERKIKPHLTDEEGREIYDGESYWEIGGKIYSAETLEEHKRWFYYDK